MKYPQAEATRLIAECQAEIANGASGWFYVRSFLGLIVCGWDIQPVELPGIIWESSCR